MSKDSDNYGTPLEFYQELNKRFHFRLDPCAWPENALKAPNFFTEVDNGLALSWLPGPCYVNPPYSIGEPAKWTKKAYEESLKGVLSVMLMRADSSTKWWNTWVKHKAIVVPVPYRLKFVGGDGLYNFPSTLLIYTGLFQ